MDKELHSSAMGGSLRLLESNPRTLIKFKYGCSLVFS